MEFCRLSWGGLSVYGLRAMLTAVFAVRSGALTAPLVLDAAC